jgi:Fe-S cluster biogenesis protein NfuA
MFIQTETTPNPDVMKFLPGQPVMASGTRDYGHPAEAVASPLALALFSQPGVARVFLGADFVSVTKRPEVAWTAIRTLCLAAIMDHFMAGLPVVEDDTETGGGAADAVSYDDETQEIVDQIVDLIDTRVRPAVAGDGGDIIFRRFVPETGLVQLTLRGACAGCPSSTATLKSGIETMLRTYVPEVRTVEAVG